MKKILLIASLFSLLSCSDDSSENTLTPDPMDGLSVVKEITDCIEPNECYINYKVKNESEYEKHFYIHFNLAESDSHYDGNIFIKETISEPNEGYIVQVFIDEGNSVESVEIVDVQIIE